MKEAKGNIVSLHTRAVDILLVQKVRSNVKNGSRKTAVIKKRVDTFDGSSTKESNVHYCSLSYGFTFHV